MALHWLPNGTNQNATINYTSSSFSFNPLEAWSRSSGTQTSVPFTSSSTANSTVTVTFPGNATSFCWQGVKHSQPSLYSICIDCTDLLEGILIDGKAERGESTETVATLFSKDGLSNSPHVITITNLIDPRTGVAGELTISSIIISRPISQSDSSTTASTPQGTNVGQSPSSSADNIVSSSFSFSPTSTSALWTSSTASAAMGTAAYWSPNRMPEKPLRTPTSTGVIIGATISGALIIFGSMGALWWFATRKRRAYAQLSPDGPGFKRNPKKKLILDPESTITHNANQASFTKNTLVNRGTEPSKNLTAVNLGTGNVMKSSDHPRVAERPISFPPSHLSKTEIPGYTPFQHLSQIPEVNVNAVPVKYHPQTPPPTSDRWGMIPVALSNPFSSSGSDDFDFDSPLPSSEAHASFPPPPRAPSIRDGNQARLAMDKLIETYPSSLVQDSRDAEETSTTTPRGWMKVDDRTRKKSLNVSPRYSLDLFPQSVRSHTEE